MNNLDDIITPTFSWLKEKNKVAIATVISTWGSAPRQVGGQMAINETGEIIDNETFFPQPRSAKYPTIKALTKNPK